MLISCANCHVVCCYRLVLASMMMLEHLQLSHPPTPHVTRMGSLSFPCRRAGLSDISCQSSAITSTTCLSHDVVVHNKDALTRSKKGIFLSEVN